MIQLEHTYADAVPALSLDWDAAAFPDPQVVTLDEPLARELGLDPAWLRTPEGVAFLTGHGGGRTVAQAYAGHQFGGYSPRLGDGRALLLGEVPGPPRRDLHLKGSGRTPFSRGGDGKAALGPMLREHLVSAAMHALGIPTSRALAVVGTGEQVLRERLLPGAVLVRVASSHLRVGTVQLAASAGSVEMLRDLVAHASERHPGPREGVLGFYAGVVERQAALVARWMGAGFVHGVMNTDNMTLSGETIDYGPCAFLDAHDPRTVFSSIDHQGRYAYGNQPAIAQWDLARLAEALVPLVVAEEGCDEDGAVRTLSAMLGDYVDSYERAAHAEWSRKLGLADAPRELVAELLSLLAAEHPDHTGFFRGLVHDEVPPAFAGWAMRWRAAHPDLHLAAAANPVYVPRNHRVEEALTAASSGDLAPFERLLDAVTHPFEERSDLDDLAGPAPDDAPPHVTYCGT